jgi:vacuolar-type H+-ATPase subunit H
MTPETSGRNPLEAIRAEERASAQAVEEARKRAEGTMAAARAEADTLVAEARRRGTGRAERHHREEVARAEAGAGRITAETTARIAELRRRVEPHREAAVNAVVTFVLSTKED